MDQVIEALLQLYPLPNRYPNLFQQEIRNTLFLEGYVLSIFVVYKGYMDEIQTSTFDIIAHQSALLLKQLALSLKGIAFG